MVRTRLTALFAVVIVFVSACSGAGDGATSTEAGQATDTGFPVSVTTATGSVTVADRPSRIAALSATHVEMLYAIGAGDQLIAGDLFSNYPPEAAQLQQVDSFNLNVEAVVALEPDLVVLSFDPVDAVAALAAVGIPTLLLGTAGNLDDVYAQLGVLGAATGHRDEAAAVVAGMAADIDAIVADVGDQASGLSYYHETDPISFYTPSSLSFIGQIYGLLGLESIADAAPDEFESGFPQLSPEFIIAANPDLLFLAGGGETLDTVAARQGWDTLTAVEVGNVFVLDPDVASRWGPRIVELLDDVAAAVAGAKVPVGAP